MKTSVLCVFLVCYSVYSAAQQDPLSSQYAVNSFIINPAYSGFSKDFTAWASYRVQWAGVDGAPETKYLSGHVALADNRMGVGVTLLQDKIGSDNNTQVVASYGYHLLFSESSKFSFGLRGGFSNYRLDYTHLQIDRTDPKFQSNMSEFSPVIGAGFIYSTDRFFASFSVPNLLKASTVYRGVETVLYNQHAYLQVAYVMPLSARIKLKTFMLARAVRPSFVNLDGGGMLSIDDSYSIGIFTRSLHTYGALAKLHLGETLRLAYIFELPTNKSVGMNYTTHEFSVGIRMAFLRSHELEAVADF